jgi:hypothetical protein
LEVHLGKDCEDKYEWGICDYHQASDSESLETYLLTCELYESIICSVWQIQRVLFKKTTVFQKRQMGSDVLKMNLNIYWFVRFEFKFQYLLSYQTTVLKI